MSVRNGVNGHTKVQQHYKDWPNEGAFNALGDQKKPIELEVSGNFPASAAGTLYRTGPGGYKVPRNGSSKKDEFAVSHWFDGFTTVHKFDIVPSLKGTKVWYSSYSQVDELIEKARATGEMNIMSFAQKRDPCDGLYKKLKTAFFPKEFKQTPNSANVGVSFRETLPAEKRLSEANGRSVLTVVTDTSQSKTFDAETLEPLGIARMHQLHPDLTGPFGGAHAAVDPVTGDVFNYNLQLGRVPTYRVFRAKRDGEVEILAEISGKDIRGAYIHSMMLSDNFVILCIWPAYYRLMGLSILWNRNMLDSIEPFDPNSTATWVVVDRKRGRGVVKKFTTPPFFCFHTVNAWEEPSVEGREGSVDVICELSQFDNMDILHCLYYQNMVSSEVRVGSVGERLFKGLSGELARYRLGNVSLREKVHHSSSINAEKVMAIRFPDAGDLPRINPSYALRKHRYVYSMVTRKKSAFMDGIVKTDTETQTSITWEQDKCTPSEPIFIPTPGEGRAEDDGVVLCVVFDGAEGKSFLLCLDARTMKEVGVADVGRPMGMTFHGTHMPKKML